MSAQIQVIDETCTRRDLIKHAEALLSQQIWCWGCDIMRPNGNWLIEIGFKRIEPPNHSTWTESLDHLGNSCSEDLQLIPGVHNSMLG